MARNPFEFLNAMSQQNMLVHLLLAIIRKSGGEIELSLQDITAVNEGESFFKYPGDSGTSLVLRFARKGAEAYFLSEAASPITSPPTTRPSSATRPMQSDPLPPPTLTSSPPPNRHSVHDDLDYALREEEMAQRAVAAARRRNQQARAEAQTLPWRTVKPQ